MFALVLAGGRGERLRPLTDTMPKPMVPIDEKPILWYQVTWFKMHGITDVVFLVGYRWENVKEYFGDGRAFGINAHYSVEETPLGRGGAIRKGLSQVPQSERVVLVTNGDVVCTADLTALLAQHRTVGATATDMLVPLESPYGIVDLDQKSMITGFREKPTLPYWINGGVYALARNIDTLLPIKGDHEDSTFPRLALEGKMAGFPIREPWRSVDSFKDLKEAEPVAKQLVSLAETRNSER